MTNPKGTRPWARWATVGLLSFVMIGGLMGGAVPGLGGVVLFSLALTWAWRSRAAAPSAQQRAAAAERNLLEMQGANEPGERDRTDKGYGR